MNYTEEQKRNILMIYPSLEEYERISKLQEAQRYLEQTDYIANKIVEYQVLGKELEQDYTETLLKREEARQIIRNLENK
jgi:hypothetical protein